MNQEKIGKFISVERKNNNLTQKQLADKLSLSEKTISKWECGKGLPEVSLMQPLCKELNISVNELLNGTKDKKEDKAIIEYLKYEKKKSKNKIIILTIVSLLLITFILSTVIYFFNSYNKIAVYEMSGTSENFSYSNGMLTKSNMYNILYYGKIVSNNDDIKTEDITGYTFKCGNLTIVGGAGENAFNTLMNPTIEPNGYNEILSSYKLNNLDKWTLTVWYYHNGENKSETINLKNKVIMKNNEFVSIKANSISDDFEEEKEAVKDIEIGKKLEKERKYYTNLLKEDGYLPTKENKYKLKKEISEKEYLIFYTDTKIFEYYKIKNDNNFSVMKLNVLSPNDSYYDNELRKAEITGLNNGKKFSYLYLINTGSYGWRNEEELQSNRHEITSTYLKHLEILEQIIYPEK